MADKEADDSSEGGPSLEMPSFGFGRKKKSKKERPVEDPAPADLTEELPREEAAVAEAAPVPPEPEPAEAVAEPEPAPLPVEETRPMAPVAQAPEPEARPLFADDEPETVATYDDAPEPEVQPEPQRRADRGPLLTGMPASVLTGVFLGLLLVGLTWASLHLCELLRGTSTCGRPGFLILLAIMVILIVVGALLLKAFRVEDPGMTSFLGVGLMAVLILLFLVNLLFNWWMVIVVPALGLLAFAVARWLNTAFVDRD